MRTRGEEMRPEAWTGAPGPGEVHVWRVALERPPEALERLRALLSPSELERAGKFYFARDRDRYIAARGALRAVLGGCLGMAAGAVCFDYGPHGKPRLAGGPAGVPLGFNLSHSGGLAMIAVTHGREAGIDIEQIRPRLLENLPPESVFSPREAAWLAALPEGRRVRGFFECWTCKEAFIKAVGGGLSIALDRFSVALGPDGPPRLLDVQEEYGPPERWGMAALEPGEEYAAALVVEGGGWRTTLRDFDEKFLD